MLALLAAQASLFAAQATGPFEPVEEGSIVFPRRVAYGLFPLNDTLSFRVDGWDPRNGSAQVCFVEAQAVTVCDAVTVEKAAFALPTVLFVDGACGPSVHVQFSRVPPDDMHSAAMTASIIYFDRRIFDSSTAFEEARAQACLSD